MRILLVIIVLYMPFVQANTNTTITLTSDYILYGVSMSGSSPAFQLGVEKSFDEGVYMGVWTSKNTFFSAPSLSVDQEVDLYLGYSWQYTSHLVLDTGFTHYRFLTPSLSTAIEYNEAYFALTHNDYTYRLACSADFPGYDPDQAVSHCIVGVNYTLASLFDFIDVEMSVNYSHSFSQKNSPWTESNDAFGDESQGYWHAGLYVSKTIGRGAYVFSLEDTSLNTFIVSTGLKTSFSASYHF